VIDPCDCNPKDLLQGLLAYCPDWADFQIDVEEWDGPKGRGDLVLRIPSENPTVAEPLTILLSGNIRLYWHRGYFFDFLGNADEQVSETTNFLTDFFAEEILCSVFVREGQGAGGGPIDRKDPKPPLLDFDCLELRSWHGTFDQDVLR